MADMNHIGECESNWSDRYGICLLTGEADALGERILADVNAAGRELLMIVLGMPDLSLSACMNSTVNGERSVGSLFIPYGMLECIKVVALMRLPGVVEVWKLAGGSLRGMTEEDCNKPMYLRYMEGEHTRGLSGEEYQEWYDLLPHRCSEPTDQQLRRLYELEAKRSSFFGIVKRWVKAPRNRRGPAGDSLGLTHAKML